MEKQNNDQPAAAAGAVTIEQTPQPPKGGAEVVQEQAAEVKPAYVPKYTIKKGKETEGFQFKELSYREVVFEDMIAAQRISGESEGNQFNLAIVAQTCEFDGKKATYEDLQKLKWADFLELRSLLTDCDWMGSAEQLSYSLGKLGLI